MNFYFLFLRNMKNHPIKLHCTCIKLYHKNIIMNHNYYNFICPYALLVSTCNSLSWFIFHSGVS